MAYTSRKRRARMAERETMSEGMHDNDNPELDGPAPVPAAEPEAEAIHAFVPPEFFKGRKMKVGDTETVRVESIDPETGEHEIVCTYESEGAGKSLGEMMDEEVA